MGRKLPTYDPDRDGEYFNSKRRTQVFKRIYQNYYHWQSLRETGEVGDILSVDGEEIYIGDLMTGIETLPPRQRQAFELICLRGYTESAATAILLPNSRWSTPVQQYSDDGLKKMIAAYDAKQNGTWNPVAAMRRKRRLADKPCQDTPEQSESIAVFITGCSISADDKSSENEDSPRLKSAKADSPEMDNPPIAGDQGE